MFGLDDIIGGIAGGVGALVNNDNNTQAANQTQADLDKSLALINQQQGYDNIAAKNYNGYSMPDQVNGSQVADSPEARNMMVQKLKQISDLADKGQDNNMKNQYINARNIAETANKGNQDALKNEFERRGMGGGGNELMMREMANQGANDSMATSMAKQAADNANLQYQAGLASFTGAGQLRGQDVSLNKSNADIINDFNKLNAKNKQETNNANTALGNTQIQENNTYNRNLSAANTNLANSKLTESAGMYANQMPKAAQDTATANTYGNNALMGDIGQIGKGLFGDNKPAAKYDTTTGEEIHRYDPNTGALIQ